MRILIGGDVVPTAENRDAFEAGDAAALLGGLLPLWEGADLRMFNLECPITDEKTRLFKNGPSLTAPSACLNGIRALKPDLLLLANNHILDAGPEGLTDLLKRLDGLGIAHTGAVAEASGAPDARVLDVNGKKLAVYACCDTEFSLCGPDRAGAVPLDESAAGAVRALKAEADAVIAVYHGGKEYYRYPSPGLRQICRALADAGADLVLCQHSHCIGARERYKNAEILYGQGNFIFNKKHDDFWRSSLLVSLTLEEGPRVEYIPIVQSDKGTSPAQGEDAKRILEDFEKRSAQIADGGFVERSFSEFADGLLPAYLYTFAGWGPYRAALDRKLFHGRLIKERYSRKRYAAMWNFIAAQAHREALLRGLENRMDALEEDQSGKQSKG